MAVVPLPLFVSSDVPAPLGELLDAAVARARELLSASDLDPVGTLDEYASDGKAATKALALTLAQLVRVARFQGGASEVERELVLRERGCAELTVRWYAFPHCAHVTLEAPEYGELVLEAERLNELIVVLDADHTTTGVLHAVPMNAPTMDIGGTNYVSIAQSLSCYCPGGSGTLVLDIAPDDVRPTASLQQIRFPLQLAKSIVATLRKRVVPLAKAWLAQAGLALPEAYASDSRTGRRVAPSCTAPAPRRRKVRS